MSYLKNLHFPPLSTEERILKNVDILIGKGRLGNLFRANRPDVVLEHEKAVALLKRAGADDSVYERLTSIWGSDIIGWSPHYEELTQVLGVNWDRVKSKNREEWIEPLSFMICRGGEKT